MRRGASSCYHTALIGAVYPLEFTGNVASSFGTLRPVSVLVFCTCQKGFFCKTQCMYMRLGSFLHISAFVVFPMIPFKIGALVSHGAPVSVAVCHLGWFILDFPGVLFSLSYNFLAHECHPSS